MPVALGANFLAYTGSGKPDTTGDVGPTQVLVTLNNRVRAFDKTGVPAALDAPTQVFWDAVRHGGGIVSDPRVRFDPSSGRWFLSMESIAPETSAFRFMLAVSDGPEISDATRFTFFAFDVDEVGPQPSPDNEVKLGNMPSLGVDRNALYLGFVTAYNNPSRVGATLMVVRKSSVLGEGPIVVTAFRRVSTDLDGGIAFAQGVSNGDPAASEGYFVGVDFARTGVLVIRRVADPGGTPRLSPELSVVVPATSSVPFVAARGGYQIYTGGDRLLPARLFFDRATGERTLWTSHTVGVGADGVAPGDRAGARWYQIAGLESTPVLVQSGTIVDTGPASQVRGAIYPSVAMSAQGHALMGWTSAGPTESPEGTVARRLGLLRRRRGVPEAVDGVGIR